MTKKSLREFLQKKVVIAGCAILTAAAVAGGAFAYQASVAKDVPELVSFVDSTEGDNVLGDEGVPLAGAKTTTKTSTKQSTTKVTLPKAATKTYTKAIPATTKTATSTTKSGNTTIKKTTTVKTAKTEKYTKKSKVKAVTTKVTTTITTTESAAAAASTVAIASIAPKADAKVLNAYQTMGFTVKIDPSVTSYTGYFNSRPEAKSIILRNNDDTIYHELGHYVAFIAGNVDKAAAFQSAYSSEKSSYTGSNKAYVTSNASEYFAESFKDYTLSPSSLKSSRPQTYAAIESALGKITTSRVAMITKIYYA